LKKKDRITDPLNTFNEKYFKTVLYDILLFKMSDNNDVSIFSKKFTSKELCEQLFDALYEKSENLRSKLEEILQNVVDPPVAEENLENDTKPASKQMDMNTLLTKLSKQIGKMALKNAYEPKGLNSAHSAKAKKPKKAPKLKPSKLKESFRLEICENNDENYSADDLAQEKSENDKRADFNFKKSFKNTYSIDNDKNVLDICCDDEKWFNETSENPIKTDASFLFEISQQGDEEEMAAFLFSSRRSFEAQTRQTKYQKTALHHAAKKGDTNLCRQLLEKNLSVNSVDNFLWTPAHHACFHGHFDCLKLFAEHEADFEHKRTLSESSCLHLAVMSGNFEIVKFLIENYKFDIEAENLSGKTPLSLAKEFSKIWPENSVYNQTDTQNPGSNKISDYFESILDGGKKDSNKKNQKLNASSNSGPDLENSSQNAKIKNKELPMIEHSVRNHLRKCLDSPYLKILDDGCEINGLDVTPEKLLECALEQSFAEAVPL